jgi:hypothetical protein|tara:strand:- start:1168 stop:1302 length:135 start_codon:yes stop_codon:yes gene_type:complete
MFIKFTWKNSKGEVKEAYIEPQKVQGFIDGFMKKEVQPELELVN